MALIPTVVSLIVLWLSLVGSTAAARRRLRGKIDTVVVLMEENNSFDRIFGWLNEVTPTIDGLSSSSCNQKNFNNAPAGTVCASKKDDYNEGGGNHDYESVARQIFGAEAHAIPNMSQDPPPMSGFADNAKGWGGGPNMMSGYNLSLIPVSSTLATEFGICDNCFASVPGPTVPNRLFLHAGTAEGVLTWDANDIIKGWSPRTIFNVLSEHGISWGVYFHDAPSAIELTQIRKPRWLRRFHPIGQFQRHAAAGRLPRYCFIEPRYFDYPFFPGSDNSFHDVRYGEQLIKYLYESLRNSRHWERSLFIVTYDEHGGFHDHVPTPLNVPSPDNITGTTEFGPFKFDRLGVRIPVYVISPWLEPGTVIHTPINPPSPSSSFDHTMIIATLRDVFHLTRVPSAFLTRRDAWAPSLLPFLNRSTPRKDCPTRLPEPFPPAPLQAASVNKQLSSDQLYLLSIMLSLTGKAQSVKEIKSMAQNLSVGEAGSLIRSITAKYFSVPMFSD